MRGSVYCAGTARAEARQCRQHLSANPSSFSVGRITRDPLISSNRTNSGSESGFTGERLSIESLTANKSEPSMPGPPTSSGPGKINCLLLASPLRARAFTSAAPDLLFRDSVIAELAKARVVAKLTRHDESIGSDRAGQPTTRC